MFCAKNIIMMNFIPVICADPRNVLTMPDDILMNFYLENGVMSLQSYSPEIIDVSTHDVPEIYNRIVMVHMLCPNDVGTTYKMNYPYFPFIRSLKRVGLTIHYKKPKLAEDEYKLFDQVLDMHLDLPNAVWYIENEHNDLLGVMRFVQSLRDIGIESYMLIDTCHLQEDIYKRRYGSVPTEHDMTDIIRPFTKYIGAYHLSAAQGYEGMIQTLHGKPIISDKDEVYFTDVVRKLYDMPYKNDVYMIAEVQEEDYSAGAGRLNGKKAYRILKNCLRDKEHEKQN